MKILRAFFLFLTLTLLFSISACKKERSNPRITGRVLEYGTNRPIPNAEVELYTCAFFGNESGCTLSQTILSDASGRYEIEYEPASGMLTAKAEGYFDGGELVLDPSQNEVELDFVLDPFAWLNVRVVNEAPTGELDRLFLSALITPNPGSPEEYYGEDVNLDYIIKKRGNRNLRIAWNTYELGVQTGMYRDTVFLEKHDTLSYEIRY